MKRNVDNFYDIQK